jgi:diadenosine tetraphosphate (Ap4A) HIT family hydrolase
MLTSDPCVDCGFGLFLPVANLSVSSLGIYDDARFSGRSILTLSDHYDDMIDVPEGILNSFLCDSRKAINAIMKATGCTRVNFAILGNRESHVHAHLIPRYPEKEEFPDCSPWNDNRAKTGLSKDELDFLRSKIAVSLQGHE